MTLSCHSSISAILADWHPLPRFANFRAVVLHAGSPEMPVNPSLLTSVRREQASISQVAHRGLRPSWPRNPAIQAVGIAAVLAAGDDHTPFLLPLLASIFCASVKVRATHCCFSATRA